MNKFNKGKTLGIVAASLASVALVGVGFSTWIIKETNEAPIAGIQVKVADTKELSVKITNAKVGDDKSVNFEADHNKWQAVIDSKGTPILSCNSGDRENLTFSISYDVTVSTNVDEWEIKAAIIDTDDNKFNKAVHTREYITLPSTLEIGTGVKCLNQNSQTDSSSGLTVTEGSSISVTQTFTFGWGRAFAGKNPVEVVKGDQILPQNDTKLTSADDKNLVDNTKAMKTLGLSAFTIQLSVGTITPKASASN